MNYSSLETWQMAGSGGADTGTGGSKTKTGMDDDKKTTSKRGNETSTTKPGLGSTRA